LLSIAGLFQGQKRGSVDTVEQSTYFLAFLFPANSSEQISVKRRCFLICLGSFSIVAGVCVWPLSTWAASRPPARQADKVLVVGDSFSAEYGLERGTGWVALLEQKLSREGASTEIVNASVVGDTSSGGRSRLTALLYEHHPSHVVLALGLNDMLRGQPLELVRSNLKTMIRSAKAGGAQVLLIRMKLPPNYAAQLAQDFSSMYVELALTEGITATPFLLANVVDSANASQLFQADRMHPNEQAQTIMLNNVWPALKKLFTAP
jgi:acyl-CoA thioesterase I